MLLHNHISASVHRTQMNEGKSVTEIQMSVKNKMFPNYNRANNVNSTFKAYLTLKNDT